MFENGQIARCQQRKSALLQQSATHRRALMTEAQNFRPAAAWVDLGIGVGRKARTGWTALAPLLSCWQTRKKSPPGFVQKLAGAVSLAGSLTALWKSWH